MKTLFIGDIHGIDTWKQPVAQALAIQANVVFVGDYVDAFDIKPHEIMENLNDIIKIKKAYPAKITLLIGNHDYAYVFGKRAITGFNHYMEVDYRSIFNDNWKLFDLAWGFQGKDKYTLVTHAGLTWWFYKEIEETIKTTGTTMHDILVKNLDVPWKELQLHELLNYFKDQTHIAWKIGRERGGLDPTGGILWADKYELMKFHYKGINQIVGHTPGKYIEICNVDEDQIMFIDAHLNKQLYPIMVDLI